MKKLFTLVAIMATLTIYAGGIIGKPDASTVESFSLQFVYTTPYGVPKVDADGNVIKDEKGSPIVVFRMRKLREEAVMRMRIENGEGICEFARLTENDEIVWDRKTPATFVSLPMEDGGRLLVFCFDYVITNRGLGVTPANIKVWSTVLLGTDKATGKATYHSSQMQKPDKEGNICFASGSGQFGGFSSGEDEGAWANVEEVTFLKSNKRLPIFGSFNITHYGMGTMTAGSIKRILHRNDNIFSFYAD